MSSDYRAGAFPLLPTVFALVEFEPNIQLLMFPVKELTILEFNNQRKLVTNNAGSYSKPQTGKTKP
jgi:hypothetical protein